MRWLDSIADSMDINLSKLWETVKGRGAEVPRRSCMQEEDTHTQNAVHQDESLAFPAGKWFHGTNRLPSGCLAPLGDIVMS